MGVVVTGTGAKIGTKGGVLQWPQEFPLSLGDYANDIGSCVGWFDASDLSTLFVDKTQTANASADGDLCGEWQDKSDASVPAHVQSDNANSENWPSLILNKRNGLPGLYFNGDVALGTNIRMITYTGGEDILANYTSSGMTIIFVGELDDSNEDPAATVCATARNNVADSRGFSITLNTTERRFHLQGDIGGGAGSNPPANTGWRYEGSLLVANDPFVHSFRVTDASPDTEQAGISNGSSTLLTDVAPNSTVSTPQLPDSHDLPFAIGAQHSSSFSQFNGWMYELIVFNKTLTDAELNLLMNILRMKWDI